MALSINPKQNQLLAALPAAELERLSPHLELVAMPLGEVLFASGGKLQHVYFPTTSIVSLHSIMENGSSTEIAGVGNEGMLGMSLGMSSNTSRTFAFVRAAGFGYKLESQLLMDEFNIAGPIQRLLLRYNQALMTQTSQTALCTRHHSLEQQLCRWLLLTLDQVPANELMLTQELVASMLGVRRGMVTEAAGKLQQAGFISCQRGHITVLDRTGLEDHACECYNVIKAEFDSLLGRDFNPWNMPESIANTRSGVRANYHVSV